MRQLNVARWCNFRLEVKHLLLGIILVTSCSAAVVPREEEGYLRGTQGPYRGRVVDAQTKKPIAGAVVVAVWYIDTPALVQRNAVFYDAVEVLTDADGYFVVDAPEIERRAPQNTEFPDFTIFKPAYFPFEGWFASPEVMKDRQRQGLLRVVELKRASPRENRSPFPGAQVPKDKIPNLLKAMEEERRRY